LKAAYLARWLASEGQAAYAIAAKFEGRASICRSGCPPLLLPLLALPPMVQPVPKVSMWLSVGRILRKI